MALRKDQVAIDLKDGVPTFAGHQMEKIFEEAVSGEVIGKIASKAYDSATMSPALASIMGPGHLEDFHKIIDAHVAHVVKKVLEYQAGKGGI